jgi:hypothetical protein
VGRALARMNMKIWQLPTRLQIKLARHRPGTPSALRAPFLRAPRAR